MTVHDAVGAIQDFGGIFGGIAALLWVGRRLIMLDRAVTQMSRLANAELSHNGGHSTKDYAAKGYRKARKVEHQVERLEGRLNAHLDAHAASAPTVIAKAGVPDA